MLPVLVMSALMMQNAPALPSVTPPASASSQAKPAAAQPGTPAPSPASSPAPVEAAPVMPVAQVTAAPEPAPAPPAPVVAPSPAPAPSAKPGMIKVDAYHEKAGDRTDSNIWSAFNAKQSESGGMEGTWVVTSADGRKLVSFELRADAPDHHLEGAWRSLTNDVGLTRSGFISDLFLDGPALEINYARSKTATPTVLELRKSEDGQWRGVLLDAAGHKTAVVMSHSVHAS